MLVAQFPLTSLDFKSPAVSWEYKILLEKLVFLLFMVCVRNYGVYRGTQHKTHHPRRNLKRKYADGPGLSPAQCIF